MSPLVGSPVSLQTITLNQQCQERKSSKIERINTQELQEEQVKQKVELRRVQSSCNIEILVPSKSPSCLDMEKYEERNGSISKNDGDDDSTTVYFFIGNRREVACWRSDKVTSQEIKELFRSAAEAGPLDIVKLRKCDKILNITPHLLSNTSDDPYILQVVGAHPASLRIFEVDLLLTLERRLVALERELHIHQEVTLRQPYFSLCELKKHYDSLKKKLETTEHLSWLGFYKQLPEPISSEACRRLQYRRKSDSMKRSVREKFLNICDVAVSQNVRKWLRSPAFDARQWEDEELLLMLQTMFVELELPQKFNIPLSTLRNFIYEVYNNYNEVPFHNFRHCFCVAQMMYAIAWAVDLISKIGDREVLVLIVSCVCHDLDHPGYNNIYQINARTELALRYNDISPLENHHCSIAFRILETPECNIFASLDLTTYKIIREGIIRCILATDMARHNEILAQFTDAVLEFDFTSKIHINLLSMVLIKVADISNEARPMDVAEPWLDSLLQEFFKQSDAEKLEGLPITPFMDRDKVTKPSSQCSFIGLVLLPLFEVLGELFPELQELIVQPVRYALEYYRRLNEQAKDERHQRKSVVDVSDHIATVPSGSSTSSHQRAISLNSASSMGSLTQRQFSIVKSTSSHSMRLKRTTCTLHSRSRSIEDKTTSEQLMMQESCDMESSDPETATEVEISEKTLKFKISTESGVSTSTTGRKSYPGSRKGSREKSSLDYHNHELVKAMRGYEHERRRSRGENFNSNMSSPVSGRSNEFRILEELEGDDQHLVELVFSDKKKRKGNGNLRLNAVQQQRDSHLSERNVSVDSNECDFVNANSKEIVENVVRCCCEEKTGANNHKSLLTRLRQITDRLSINFDTKEMLTAKSSKCVTNKNLNKNVLINYNGGSTSDTTPRQNNFVRICKKCNLRKINNNKGLNIKSSTIVEQLVLSGSTSMTGKHSMTLPKVTRSQDSKNKSWRTVFAKEKRPSISLETLPAESITKIKAPGTSPKHRRNLSHPEGRTNIESVLPKGRISETEQQQNQQSPELQQTKINFKEIDVCPAKLQKCVDLIDSGNSAQSTIKNIGKMEIRRSSASMEDISKITKQSEGSLLGCSLEQKKFDEYQQHAGSLDSMLYKDTPGSDKKPVIVSKTVLAASPQTKKSSAGLFSRFKSGMSTDAGACSSSNSGSLNDQQTQGWISSITASFRARRHGEQPMITTTMTTTMKPASAQSSQEQQQSSSTNREVE